MAACGSLQHIFDEKPLPENAKLLEPSSPWDQTKSTKPPIDDSSSFTDSDSISGVNSSSDSLSICTEGLGFESCDDVEELLLMNENSSNLDFQQREVKRRVKRSSIVPRKSFPPPISCIGRDGKPWVSFKSYREDGRFVLQEIRFPAQEFLHACREDGRLKMHFVQSSDDEMFDEDDEDLEEANEDVNHNDDEEYEKNAGDEKPKDAENDV